MAKKQAFGEQAQHMRESHRKMAKVIIATRNNKGKFSYKEAMVDQENAKDFIQQNKS
ncbi:MAG: DUF4295 family protein [Balneolaceae bacterium]